jgi:hypothetical protein
MADIKGGNKLESRLEELARKLKRGAVLKVGFLENATYSSGEKVALIAALNDFGHGTTPPRPFFRNMVADKKGEWPAAIEGLLKKTDYDAEKTLSLAGEAIAGQLRQAIADFEGAPLKPATIARKGHSKQLVDSGTMLNAVDFEVESTG